MSTSNFPSTSSSDATLAEVVVRLTELEREVQQLRSSRQDYSKWLDKIKGSMKDDPDFAEVLRLGAEIRKADFS